MHPCVKKAIRILVGLMALPLILDVLALLYIRTIYQWTGPYFATRESIQALSEASSEEGARSASKGLGAFLTFPDHSWLAIRCKETHVGWSVAIARDNEGRWYQSREHFCGSLLSVRDHQLWLDEEREFGDQAGEPLPEPSDPHSKWIRFVSDSPDLETARQRLTSKYFKPFSPD